MIFEYKPSFKKSIKALAGRDKKAVIEFCKQLVDVLEKQKTPTKGLGLKRLTKDLWEIRAGIKIRIIIKWKINHVAFVTTGNHDHIKRYLKSLH